MVKPANTLPLDAYQRLLAQQEKNARRSRPRHQESDLQRTCVCWFRTQYPNHALMLFAVPNGGGRSRIEASIMKGEGVTAGVADLILLEARGGYGSLCIEMKIRDKGSKQRPSQKAWQEAAEKAGNLYVVIRSFEAFRATVSEYMGLPPAGRVFVKPEEVLVKVKSRWKGTDKTGLAASMISPEFLHPEEKQPH